jgi:hypothetical protein
MSTKQKKGWSSTMEPIVIPANNPLKPYHHPADPSLRRPHGLTVLRYERRPKADPFKPLLRQAPVVASKVSELTLAYPVYPEYTGAESLDCQEYSRLLRRLQLRLLAVGDTRWATIKDEQRLEANTKLILIWLARFHATAPDILHQLGAFYTEASNNRWDLPRLLRELQRQRLLPRQDQLTHLTLLVNLVLDQYGASVMKCRLGFITAKLHTTEQIFTVLLGLGTP